MAKVAKVVGVIAAVVALSFAIPGVGGALLGVSAATASPVAEVAVHNVLKLEHSP